MGNKTHGPRIVISARVDPLNLALAATFIDKAGVIFNKSDLISACVDLAANLARKTTDIKDPEQYEDAFNILRRLGIEWSGEAAKKDLLRALQNDALTDLEPDQVAELGIFLNELRSRKKTEKAEEEKSPLLKEIEKLES